MPGQSIRSTLQSYIHALGLIGLAVGLSTSKVVLSLSMMLLALSLFMEGKVSDYLTTFRNNRLLQLLTVFWCLHLLGLCWTQNFTYALNDIRIKLSLIVIPILLILQPPKPPITLNRVLLFFIGGLLVTSLINWFVFQHHVQNNTVEDIRQLSLFGSHIRFGILIAIGVAVSIWLITKTKYSLAKYACFIPILWFTYYTYYSQILSGLIALLSVFFFYLFWYTYRFNRTLGIGICVCFVLIAVGSVYYVLSPVQNEKLDADSLPKWTKNNHPYSHNLDRNTFENGRAVLAFVCEEELRDSWNKRSDIPYDSSDEKGQPLRFTLMRYMTSKGLKKDEQAMKKLDSTDIKRIENGQCNILESNQGILARVEGLKYQLHNSLDPNGHSLLQRLHYWKAALLIIQKNWLFGVGTGDVEDVFQQTYRQTNSPLENKNRLRAHNTYLTTAVTFGVPGLILFIILLGYFFRESLKNKHDLAACFMLVAVCTFFIEDTLETQTGASFFAFFFGLFAHDIYKLRSNRS